jgi:hypothetical protein
MRKNADFLNVTYNKENNQLDATIGSLLKIPMLARHVSGNSCAHLQED